MRIQDIRATIISLPFRFAFRHNLASRSSSENVIVQVEIKDDQGQSHLGFGESIPRSYVTGENADSALSTIRTEFAPRFLHFEFASREELLAKLNSEFQDLQLERITKGASWCALELALLDAAGKAAGISLAEWLAAVRPEHAGGITYGGVVPFGKKGVFDLVLHFYKLFGFKTVKIKVGRERLEDDVALVSLSRKILGPDVKLRVDANCAWTKEQALRAAESFRAFAVLSYEQPLPAHDLEGLAAVTAAIPEQVLADESLCSIEQARNLALNRVVSAFNIRISKVGGFLAAQTIAQIAYDNGMAVHMGAQVGESGILSAAGRAFASIYPAFENCEGSNNLFLLKQDITRENLNVGRGGIGRILRGKGLGVTVVPQRIKALELETAGRAVELKSNQNANGGVRTA